MTYLVEFITGQSRICKASELHEWAGKASAIYVLVLAAVTRS